MDEWIAFDGEWEELMAALGAQEAPVGLRLRMDDGTEHIVGTINQNGGQCDCCSIRRDSIVAYLLPAAVRG